MPSLHLKTRTCSAPPPPPASLSPRLPGRSSTTSSNLFPSPRRRKMTSDLEEHLEEMMVIGLMTLEEANGYWQEDWEV